MGTSVHPYWLYKQDEDDGILTYPVADWGDGLLTRGSVIDLQKPYIVAVGAAQTFGRFAKDPYVEQLARKLGVSCINFGYAGAGPGQLFRNTPSPETTLKMINGAMFAIVQVMSVRSCSNSLFEVQGGQYGRYRDTGEKSFMWKVLKQLWQQGRKIRVRQLIKESRLQYREEYSRLMQAITVPKIVLWSSNCRAAHVPINYARFLNEGRRFPQFVDSSLLRHVCYRSVSVVECVTDAGLPHRVINNRGKLVRLDRYYPSPEAHVLMADRLFDSVKVLRRIGKIPG